MDIDKLKKLTNERENMLWINTGVYMGILLAELLEGEGIKIKRFSRHDQSELKQYLNNSQRVSREPETTDELNQ